MEDDVEMLISSLSDIGAHDIVNLKEVMKKLEGKKIDNVIVGSQLLNNILRFFLSRNTKVRAMAVRIVRYAMNTTQILNLLADKRYHYFITKSLEQKDSCMLERAEAFKMVKTMIRIDESCSVFPLAIAQSINAVANHPKDSFYTIALNILAEIAIRNPNLLSVCSGIKTLCYSLTLVEATKCEKSISSALLYILDNAETRQYVMTEDFGYVMSTFSDRNLSSAQLGTVRRAVLHLMRTWPGILYIASIENGLSSLIEALTIQDHDIQKSVLNLLSDLFFVDDISPDMARSFSQFGDPDSGDLAGGTLPSSESVAVRQNLLDNYLAVLLTAFLEANIFEALAELSKSPDDFLSETATNLLSEILWISDRVLPPQMVVDLQVLPEMMNSAADFQEDGSARRMESQRVIESLQRLSGKKWATSGTRYLRLVGRVERIKSMLDSQVDDVRFTALLRESQVLESRDHNKWNWIMISDLIAGPLSVPAHFMETLKTDFFKRLCLFFNPSKGKFARLTYNEADMSQYVSAANQLFALLISSPEGKQFLNSTAVFQKLQENLTAEKLSNFVESIFNPRMIKERMVRAYFLIIGNLSGTKDGCEVLEKNKVFSCLYPITHMTNRDDLNTLLVSSMKYGMKNDHSRILLSRLLLHGTDPVRYRGTSTLHMLLRTKPENSEWIIPLLVTQIYDPNKGIVENVIAVLLEACETERNLKQLISLRPSLRQMGEAGKYLLLRFLSSPQGYEYVNDELKAIDDELTYWRKKGSKEYVHNLEKSLNEVVDPSRSVLMRKNLFVPRPLHFLGSLASTSDGRTAIKSSGLFQLYVSKIVDSNSPPAERRAALWAVCNIGMSEAGSQFLLNSRLVETIDGLARTSGMLSIRGTCICVLGALSKNPLLRKTLRKLGWATPREVGRCICVPTDTRTIFNVAKDCKIGFQKDKYAFASKFLKKHDQSQVVRGIIDLNNAVVAEAAARTLRTLQSTYPFMFTPEAYYCAMQLMENYQYRLNTRRFIQELFQYTVIEVSDHEEFLLSIGDGDRILFESPLPPAKVNRTRIRSRSHADRGLVSINSDIGLQKRSTAEKSDSKELVKASSGPIRIIH